jgi:hypothetical protein
MKPFDVACKITGRTVEYTNFRDEYLAMMADTRDVPPAKKATHKRKVDADLG